MDSISDHIWYINMLLSECVCMIILVAASGVYEHYDGLRSLIELVQCLAKPSALSYGNSY